MQVIPEIKTTGERQLIGQRVTMSFAVNKTGELWRSFMPRRTEIRNKRNADLISMQVYRKPPDFANFDQHLEFEKWAAVEVANFNDVPGGMETFILPAGLYAVFHYRGLSTDDTIFKYIFATWLPVSEYVLDDRPHLEVLGERYKNNDPASEEEIWIPVKEKI